MLTTSRFRRSPLALASVLACAGVAPVHATTFSWSGGDYLSIGLPATLTSADIVNATSGNAKSMTGSIVNNGSINWQATDLLEIVGSATTIRNNGTFDQQANGQIYSYQLPTFDNAGTLRKSAGNGALLIDVALVNRSGATLDAGSGSIVYRNKATIEAGSVFKGAGTHQLNAPFETFSFAGNFSGENDLVFAGGTYNASALTKPQTDATFSGGRFTGQWTIDSGRTLTAVTGGEKTVNGSFTNNGTVAWNTTNLLQIEGSTTTFRNNGTFDQQANGQIYSYQLPTFDNAGTLRKSAGNGALLIDVALVNRSGATLDAGSGSIVYRNKATIEAGSIFKGAGTHQLNAPFETFSFAGNFSGENNLVFAGGTYNASALTKPQTDATFSGGRFTGQWTIDSGRTLTAVTGGEKTVNGSFTNDGTVAWNTTNLLQIEGSMTKLRNNGTFDQKTDGQIYSFQAGTFDNAGMLRKSGGIGNLVIGSALTNTGIIESLSGKIVVPDDWRNDGTLRGTAGFQTNVLTNAGDIAPGVPDTANAIAKLTLTGALVQAASGALSFDVTSGGISDLLDVSGAVTFDGILRVSRFGDYVAQEGDTFRVMNFASLTGKLTGIDDFGFADGIDFYAIYSPTHLDIRVGPVPEPETYLLMAGGLVAIWLARRRRTTH